MEKLTKRELAKLLIWATICFAFMSLAALPCFALTEMDIEARACVRVGAGGGCSGIIIVADDSRAFGVSAAHCVASVGQQFTVGFIDGTQGSARWLAVDRANDLAFFTCWSKDILGTSPIRNGLPDGEFRARAVGFPSTVGPNVKDLTVSGSAQFSNGMKRNSYKVHNGRAFSGDSGGGVFYNGKLIGVVSHMPTNGKHVLTSGPNGGSPSLYASQNNQLVAFVRSQQSQMTVNCRNNWCWTPQPNRNIDTSPLPRIPDLDTDDRRQQALQNVFDRLDGIDGQISTLNQEVANTQSAIDDLKKQIDSIESATNELIPRVSAIEAQQAKNTASLDKITGILAKLAETVESQSQANAAQDALLSSLQIQINEINTRPIVVEILDPKGGLIDRETYKPGQPIRLQFGESK